jgi:hypothetical protein
MVVVIDEYILFWHTIFIFYFFFFSDDCRVRATIYCQGSPLRWLSLHWLFQTALMHSPTGTKTCYIQC